MKPLFEAVKIELYVPKQADRVWRAVGFDETDYQCQFLEVLRSMFDAVMTETPAGAGAIKILEGEIKYLREKG